MKKFLNISLLVFGLFIYSACNNSNAQNSNTQPQSIYGFTVKDIDGNSVPLSKYKGKVLVIVNTASKCGLVEQLGEIEQFYKKYKDKGVVVLGFPANNFLSQEPLSNPEIKAFCTKNYGVSFPMFEKISVKGSDIAPLYSFLTQKSENGVLDAPIKWNYQKFIIDRNGFVKNAINPRTSVNDEEFIQALESAL